MWVKQAPDEAKVAKFRRQLLRRLRRGQPGCERLGPVLLGKPAENEAGGNRQTDLRKWRIGRWRCSSLGDVVSAERIALAAVEVHDVQEVAKHLRTGRM